MTTETRTQYRALCPACFRQQAVNADGRLANHGYQRPQGWHQNTGTCDGAGRRHFGTPEGRDYTVSIIDRLRAYAVDRRQEAVKVADGDGKVWGFKRVRTEGYGSTRVLAEVTNPLPYQRVEYARQLENEATSATLNANEFQRLVDGWTAVEPVPVTVEKKSGPLTHWSGGWWRQGKACAGSAMGAMKGFATRDAASVTCPRCLGIISSGRFAAKKEAR